MLWRPSAVKKGEGQKGRRVAVVVRAMARLSSVRVGQGEGEGWDKGRRAEGRKRAARGSQTHTK